MANRSREITLKGFPLSHGIAIGKPHYFVHSEENVFEETITAEAVGHEIERYRKALLSCQMDLKRLQKQMTVEGALEAAAILETHQQILEDPLLTTTIESGIIEAKKNAEFIFKTSVDQYLKKFEAISDPFFRERSKDLKDIARRILGDLVQKKRPSFEEMPPNSIVLAVELAASEAAEARHEYVSAFVASTGTPTSHAAIVAKAKGIPFVVNIDVDFIIKNACDTIIVDGRTGNVILNPSSSTLQRYQQLQRKLAAHFNYLEQSAKLEAVTFDGYKMRVSANIEMVSELEKLRMYGGDGVGLFRSEYIFLTKQYFPSEEEQYQIYSKIVEMMQGLPITIRAFDVGGDKILLKDYVAPEVNPNMGCRAIRFLLKEKEIFKNQLRAILRAAAKGNVSVLFPLVSSLQELLEAKQLLKEAVAELEARGLLLKPVRLGCMIEVPSAAVVADLIAKECDFLSIGTNDLIQYAMAADRCNPDMSKLYSPTHPSIIRLIQFVVAQARKYKVPVTVCGEIAADPKFTSLLIGLGIDELSVSVRYLPIVKQAIRNASIIEAVRIAEDVLNMHTSEQVDQLLNEELQKIAANQSQQFAEASLRT